MTFPHSPLLPVVRIALGTSPGRSGLCSLETSERKDDCERWWCNALGEGINVPYALMGGMIGSRELCVEERDVEAGRGWFDVVGEVADGMSKGGTSG